jgi:hypothetical protein
MSGAQVLNQSANNMTSTPVRKSVIDEELLEDDNFESDKDPFGSALEKDSMRTSINVSDDISARN